jgi:outer membrane protein assembly factor BamD (BamD/ComL family)
MATTVEAKSRDQSTAPSTRTPWVQTYRRPLLAAAIVVAALAVVAWFIMASGKRKEQFATRSLTQARAAAEAGNLPLASSELQRLISTYKGTDAANEAVITLNQVRLVNGQSELAVVGLREFLASRPPQKYVAPASALLGAALENAKRWPDAANAYTQASNAAELPYLKAAYLLDAGRAHREAGNTQEAIKAYRTVVERFSDSPSLTEAQVRLSELTAGRM